MSTIRNVCPRFSSRDHGRSAGTSWEYTASAGSGGRTFLSGMEAIRELEGADDFRRGRPTGIVSRGRRRAMPNEDDGFAGGRARRIERVSTVRQRQHDVHFGEEIAEVPGLLAHAVPA